MSRAIIEGLQDAAGLVVTPRAASARLMARQNMASAVAAIIVSSTFQTVILADSVLGGVALRAVLGLAAVAARSLLIFGSCRLARTSVSCKKMLVASAFLLSVLEALDKLVSVAVPASQFPRLTVASLMLGLLDFTVDARSMMWAIRIDSGLGRRPSLAIAVFSMLAVVTAEGYLAGVLR